jgi:transcriptional regulator with XRE-family HTH domain
MSPFAIYLKQLRTSRGKRQKTLAIELGYEPSYLSALERGEKGPPRQNFILRLIRGLSLNHEEQIALEDALKSSRRQFSIPHYASEIEFRMMRQLAPRLGTLNPLQIQLIELALSIPSVCGGKSNPLVSLPQKEDHAM